MYMYIQPAPAHGAGTSERPARDVRGDARRPLAASQVRMLPAAPVRQRGPGVAAFCQRHGETTLEDLVRGGWRQARVCTLVSGGERIAAVVS